jgi:hypothetical protein
MFENKTYTLSRKSRRISVNQKMKIASSLRFWAVSFLVLSLSACGGVINTVITQPDNIGVFKEVTLIPPEVTSEKQDADTLAKNEELKKIANDELRSLLESKNIVLSDNRKASVECHIEVTYGNRALRYLVGFGAGAGHIRVRIEMKDDGGVTRYATSSEAELAVGVFGGDMIGVAREAIKKGVTDFGSRL